MPSPSAAHLAQLVLDVLGPVHLVDAEDPTEADPTGPARSDLRPEVDPADLEALGLAPDALAQVPVSGPVVLLVAADDEGLRLFVPPAPVGDPPEADLFDLLVGVQAPDEVDAVAVGARAHAWSLDEPDERVPAAVGFALLRSGSSATRLVVPGGVGQVDLDEGAVGRIPDLCHRVLGRPTPPPSVDTAEYLDRFWLEGLLRLAVHDPAGLDWPTALAAHPVTRGGALAVAGPDDVHRHVRAWAQQVPWPVLRRRLSFGASDLVADAAEWMDDGCFSRWLLEPLLEVDDALALLEALAGEAVHDAVARAVGRDPDARADPLSPPGRR